MTCSSVMAVLSCGRGSAAPGPLVGRGKSRRAARVGGLLAGCRRAHRCARQLRPDERAAVGDAFQAPALAEGLHELQAEAAAAVEVRGTRDDHAAAPGILDFEPDQRARQTERTITASSAPAPLWPTLLLTSSRTSSWALWST